MLEGFLTRPVTDPPVRHLVESAGGTLYIPTNESKADRFVSKTWSEWEKKKKKDGWATHPCVVFGILRGTDNIIKGCEERGHDYYYIDHCYIYKGMGHQNHKIFKDRIYRIVKNSQLLTYIDTLDDKDKKRIEEQKKIVPVSISDWKKDGKHILLMPPSLFLKRFYDMNVILPEYATPKGKDHGKIRTMRPKETARQLKHIDPKKAIIIDVEANYDNDDFWETDVLKVLKQHTDRPIRVRRKGTNVPLEEDLKNCHAVVSSQSTANIDALLNGIPSFCESTSCCLPVSYTDLSKIETPYYPDNRQEWVDSLMANQFTLNEMKSGFAFDRIKNK